MKEPTTVTGFRHWLFHFSQLTQGNKLCQMSSKGNVFTLDWQTQMLNQAQELQQIHQRISCFFLERIPLFSIPWWNVVILIWIIAKHSRATFCRKTNCSFTFQVLVVFRWRSIVCMPASSFTMDLLSHINMLFPFAPAYLPHCSCIASCKS